MNRWLASRRALSGVLLVALLGGAFGAAALPAAAAAPAGSDLRVLQPTAPETPAGSTNGVVYLTIHNVGASADRLVGASTPVAAKVEIHSMTMSGAVMQMRPLDGVDIGSGGEAEFVTGGMHLMLLGLKQPLKKGQSFPLTLKFQKAGEKVATVTVTALGSQQPQQHQGK